MPRKGPVKHVYKGQAYGWIAQGENEADLFFHFGSLRNPQDSKKLVPGAGVTFEKGESARLSTAENIKLSK
jgi:cold shock CspA family protein